MRSPLAVAPVLLLVLPFVAPPAFAAAELSAKPGGKIKVIHGTPAWRESFESEMKPGLNWRLGSNAATTLTTEGGMIFGDCVIFPGEYNLALTCERQNAFKVVFHHDGISWGAKSDDGQAPCAATKVEGKQFAKALAIDFAKDPEKKGYLLRITFGPNRLDCPFESAKARTVKGKAGTKSFSAVYLERTDLDEMKKQFAASGVRVARIERKDVAPLALTLRGGGAPKLEIVGDDVSETIEGKEEQAKAAVPAFALALAEADKAAKATFTLGDMNYVFELPETLFATAKPRK